MGMSLGAAARALRRSESGVTSIEYALLGSLISIVIVAAVLAIGETLTDTFELIVDAFGSESGTEDGDSDNNFPDPCEEGGTNCGN